jgi:hypothetical protein
MVIDGRRREVGGSDGVRRGGSAMNGPRVRPEGRCDGGREMGRRNRSKKKKSALRGKGWSLDSLIVRLVTR